MFYFHFFGCFNFKIPDFFWLDHSKHGREGMKKFFPMYNKKKHNKHYQGPLSNKFNRCPNKG